MTIPITFGLAKAGTFRELSRVLQGRFALVPGDRAGSHWDLYDSAAGDLRDAGVVLVREAAGADAWWHLREVRTGALQATAPVLPSGVPPWLAKAGGVAPVAKEPAAPIPVAALPAGALRRQVQALLGDRDLRWLGALRLRQRRFEARDTADKTIARLLVEDGRLQRPGGAGARACGRQLVVEPLRGYPDAARAIVHGLRVDLRLAPAPHLLERSLALLEGPARAQALPRPEIDASASATAALAQVLMWLATEIERHRPAVEVGDDVEGLHDFRVALRTTEVLCKQLGGIFPGGRLPALIAEFSWLGKVAGATRDLDVALAALAGYRARQGPGGGAELESLAAYLGRRRAQRQTALCAALQSDRYRRLIGRWRRFLAAAERGDPGAPTAKARDRNQSIGVVVRARVARLCRKILPQGRALEPGAAGSDFHRLRKDCKKLSYLLALFADIFPLKDLAPLARKLKRVQGALGAHQDLEVQMGLLQEFLDDDTGRDMLTAGEGAAAAALLDWCRAEKDARRGKFFTRFRRLDDDRTHRRLRALLRAHAH